MTKRSYLIPRSVLLTWLALSVALLAVPSVYAEDKADKEIWEVDPEFERYRPTSIAVVPMDNFSLEEGVEAALHKETYDRLAEKGYQRITVEHVREVMDKLGITIPALLAGISPARLGQELKADAVLMGQVEQSADINAAVYDAIVVSTSLRLVDCKTGRVLWRTEQWRTAHRQWALDPINLILNRLLHAKGSREDRIIYLAREMLKTLPQGPIALDTDDLLNQATGIAVQPQ